MIIENEALCSTSILYRTERTEIYQYFYRRDKIQYNYKFHLKSTYCLMDIIHKVSWITIVS